MNIIANNRSTETNSRMLALIGLIEPFPEGCDPDFDASLEDLEREFAELRIQLGGE